MNVIFKCWCCGSITNSSVAESREYIEDGIVLGIFWTCVCGVEFLALNEDFDLRIQEGA